MNMICMMLRKLDHIGKRYAKQISEIVKDDEDYAEDFVCKISDTLYFMELQVIGYWHNFDVSKLNTAYISKSKIDSLKEKGEKAGLIF